MLNLNKNYIEVPFILVDQGIVYKERMRVPKANFIFL